MLLNLMNDASVLSQFFNAEFSCMTMDTTDMSLDMTDGICVESLQPLQKRVRFQEYLVSPELSERSPPSQRRVRISEAECQEISVPEPLYGDAPDKTMLWYQEKELFRIKWNNKRMLREYRMVMKHMNQSSLVPPDQNHYAHMKHHLEENMRGLETYRSTKALVAAKNRRDANQRMVLLEQQYQKRQGITEPKRIRRVSRSVTHTSKIIAYAQGKKDALYVGKTVPLYQMTELPA
jgi:hypothetical protein